MGMDNFGRPYLSCCTSSQFNWSPLAVVDMAGCKVLQAVTAHRVAAGAASGEPVERDHSQHGFALFCLTFSCTDILVSGHDSCSGSGGNSLHKLKA